eukprot:EG_transcript_6654
MQNYKKLRSHAPDTTSQAGPTPSLPESETTAEPHGRDSRTPSTTLSRVTRASPRPDSMPERAVFTDGKPSTGTAISLSCSWPPSTPQYRFQGETPERIHPKYFHLRTDFPVPSGGHQGFKLEHTILMRILHVCDLGMPPTHSQLLEMMETGVIPEMFHAMIAKNAPGDCFDEIRTAIETGQPTTTHLYRELVTDVAKAEVNAHWQASPHELRAFTRGNGPLSDPDMAELVSMLPDIWNIRGRTDEEKRKDQEYANLLKDLTRRKAPAAGEPLRISEREPLPPRRQSTKVFTTQLVPELPEVSPGASFSTMRGSTPASHTAAPTADAPASLPSPTAAAAPPRPAVTLGHFLTPL